MNSKKLYKVDVAYIKSYAAVQTYQGLLKNVKEEKNRKQKYDRI
jgi:hypothetical protein